MNILSSLIFISSLISFVLAGTGADYYKILGVDKKANDKEIRNAYRQLSKKYHPDKNPGDETAQHKFMEISNAYDILMDSEKRDIYDKFGENGLKNGAGNQQQRQNNNNNPFGNFFNQQFHQGPPKGQDVQTEINFDLSDFFNGKNYEFQISMMDICNQCKGTGSSDGLKHECNECKGKGRVLHTRNLGHGMMQRIEIPCSKCNGSGKQIKHKCKSCNGNGSYQQEKTFNLYLQPGSPRNNVEIFEGKGPNQPGIIPGDFHVIMKENIDNNLGYRRIGNNLYRTEVLSLKEAMFGNWSRDIKFFDNYDPKITISRKENESVQNGDVEIIKGKGMPILNSNDEFGDLFIEYVVILPLKDKNLKENWHDEL